MKNIITIFLFSASILSAQSNICQTQWIQSDGKKYKAPENMKTLEITFIDNMDAIRLKTKNHTTRYDYQSFIDNNGQMGISYKASNGVLIDMFQNGMLVIWKDNIPMLKAHCPTMKLDISKK